MATTKEQVWTAAEELVADGKTPTLANVRERLGGGSYTDISAAMQIWRANRLAAAAPIREPAPAAVAERLGDLGAEIWAAALELANGRLQTEREALEKAREEAEQTRQEAADLADQIAAELDQARDIVRQHAERLFSCTADIERLSGELAANAEALNVAAHRADIAEASKGELHARVEQLTSLLTGEQAARQEAEARAMKAAEDAAELRGRLAAIARTPAARTHS
jgi:chromosome segregation ATPase